MMETSQGLPVRVVVAERESIISLDITEMLVSHGYLVVAQTSSIIEAAALTLILQPDLLVLDQDLVVPQASDPILRLQRTSFPLAVVETVYQAGPFDATRLPDQRRIQLKKPFGEEDLINAARHALNASAQRNLAQRDGPVGRRRRRTRSAPVISDAAANVESTPGPTGLSIAG